jgi:glycosyltransferase involved in cell wall biosynthesis
MNKNLLVISNSYPNSDNTYIGDIFVKEQLKYISEYFDHVYVISPVAYGMEFLRKTKFFDYQYDNISVYFPRYFNIPFCYSRCSTIWTALEAQAIMNLIRKEKITFDLIHAHFTWPSGAVAIECKKKYNVPVVITEHTSQTFKKAIDSRDYQSINTWESADAIIRVREGDISHFDRVGIDPKKVIFIPNGFDANKFFLRDSEECKRKLGLPPDKKIILNVGNLYDEVKGHRYLVESSARIIKQYQNILIIIIGKGNLESEIEGQISRMGLSKYIHLIGGKPHDEIPLWMNACDVFVLPSLNEGNPTVMFEALGCGKPFVGTRVGGVPEIITSDTYGLLAEPGNPDDLAEKIVMALEQVWIRNTILTYAERFTWENIAKEIMNVYMRVLR